MLVVSYNGIKVHVSFSRACAEWTVPRNFKVGMRFPSGLDIHLHEVTRPE